MSASRAAIYRLGVARAISMTGTQIANVALTYRVYELTHSAVWVSGVFLATFALMGLLMPIGGWLGDRFDRRVIMIASDLGSAAAFAALAFADSPAVLIAIALVATVCEMPFLPASGAAIPNLAGDEDLAWANGLVTQAVSVGITVGPLIGGVLVGAVGAGSAFGINAVSFLLSAALVWSVRMGFQERRAPGADRPAPVPFSEGVRVSWSTRTLRILILSEVVAWSVVGWAMVSDAPLAALFDVGAIGFAALIAFWGAGMLLGSAVAGRRLGTRPIEAAVYFGAMIAVGLGVGACGLSPWFWLVLALSVLGGAGAGAGNVARQTLVQRVTPDRVRSRVIGVAEVTASLSFTLGLAVAGPVIDAIGVREAYLVSGVVFIAGALVLLPLVLRPTPPSAPA